MKITFESNNIFPTDKDGKYYPQLFLDDGLYKNASI